MSSIYTKPYRPSDSSFHFHKISLSNLVPAQNKLENPTSLKESYFAELLKMADEHFAFRQRSWGNANNFFVDYENQIEKSKDVGLDQAKQWLNKCINAYLENKELLPNQNDSSLIYISRFKSYGKFNFLVDNCITRCISWLFYLSNSTRGWHKAVSIAYIKALETEAFDKNGYLRVNECKKWLANNAPSEHKALFKKMSTAYLKNIRLVNGKVKFGKSEYTNEWIDPRFSTSWFSANKQDNSKLPQEFPAQNYETTDQIEPQQLISELNKFPNLTEITNYFEYEQPNLISIKYEPKKSRPQTIQYQRSFALQVNNFKGTIVRLLLFGIKYGLMKFTESDLKIFIDCFQEEKRIMDEATLYLPEGVGGTFRSIKGFNEYIYQWQSNKEYANKLERLVANAVYLVNPLIESIEFIEYSDSNKLLTNSMLAYINLVHNLSALKNQYGTPICRFSKVVEIMPQQGQIIDYDEYLTLLNTTNLDQYNENIISRYLEKGMFAANSAFGYSKEGLTNWQKFYFENYYIFRISSENQPGFELISCPKVIGTNDNLKSELEKQRLCWEIRANLIIGIEELQHKLNNNNQELLKSHKIIGQALTKTDYTEINYNEFFKPINNLKKVLQEKDALIKYNHALCQSKNLVIELEELTQKLVNDINIARTKIIEVFNSAINLLCTKLTLIKTDLNTIRSEMATHASSKSTSERDSFLSRIRPKISKINDLINRYHTGYEYLIVNFAKVADNVIAKKAINFSQYEEINHECKLVLETGDITNNLYMLQDHFFIPIFSHPQKALCVSDSSESFKINLNNGVFDFLQKSYTYLLENVESLTLKEEEVKKEFIREINGLTFNPNMDDCVLEIFKSYSRREQGFSFRSGDFAIQFKTKDGSIIAANFDSPSKIHDNFEYYTILRKTFNPHTQAMDNTCKPRFDDLYCARHAMISFVIILSSSLGFKFNPRENRYYLPLLNHQPCPFLNKLMACPHSMYIKPSDPQIPYSISANGDCHPVAFVMSPFDSLKYSFLSSKCLKSSKEGKKVNNHYLLQYLEYYELWGWYMHSKEQFAVISNLSLEYLECNQERGSNIGGFFSIENGCVIIEGKKPLLYVEQNIEGIGDIVIWLITNGLASHINEDNNLFSQLVKVSQSDHQKFIKHFKDQKISNGEKVDDTAIPVPNNNALIELVKKSMAKKLISSQSEPDQNI